MPVTPSVGTLTFAAAACSASRVFAGTVPASRPEISRASARVRANRSLPVSADKSCGRSFASSTSQAATISLIIPCSPIRWPSSGEKIRVTP